MELIAVLVGGSVYFWWVIWRRLRIHGLSLDTLATSTGACVYSSPVYFYLHVDMASRRIYRCTKVLGPWVDRQWRTFGWVISWYLYRRHYCQSFP